MILYVNNGFFVENVASRKTRVKDKINFNHSNTNLGNIF